MTYPIEVATACEDPDVARHRVVCSELLTACRKFKSRCGAVMSVSMYAMIEDASGARS